MRAPARRARPRRRQPGRPRGRRVYHAPGLDVADGSDEFGWGAAAEIAKVAYHMHLVEVAGFMRDG